MNGDAQTPVVGVAEKEAPVHTEAPTKFVSPPNGESGGSLFGQSGGAIRAGLLKLATIGLSAFGGFALLWLAYEAFLRPVPVPPPDSEALAKVWGDTVAQFGIAPVFPPKEDVQVGDIYAVLGDNSPDHRPRLTAQRSIKLDHLAIVDSMLAAVYENVLVFPDTPKDETKGDAVTQVECPEGCFAHRGIRKELSLVILPGITTSQARQADFSGSFSSTLVHDIFGGSSDQSQYVSISIPYAEVYGLGSLVASGILDTYCSDPGRPGLCDESAVRGQLAMVAGDLAWKKPPNSDRFEYPVYMVLVSAAYLARSVTYGFSANSAVGIQAQMYQKIQKKLEAETATPASPVGPPPVAASNPSSPTPATNPDAAATQKAIKAERARFAQIVAEAAGAPAGGTLRITAADANQVSINETLPRPVTIGFIPVMKDFRLDKGKAAVVEPGG